MAKSINNIKITKKAPRTTNAQESFLNLKYYGAEPTLSENATQAEQIAVFNWYNVCSTIDLDISKFIEYVKNTVSMDLAAFISKKAQKEINFSVARISRMKIKAGTLPKILETKLNDYINSLKLEMKNTKKVKVSRKAVEPVSVVSSAEETRKDKISNLIGDIEVMIDNGNYQVSVYNYLNANNIAKSYIADVVTYYQPLMNELEIALSGKDSQLKEAYSDLSKSELKKFYIFVKSIIDDLNRYVDNKTSQQKTRKKKIVKVESVLKVFSFMKEHKELKAVSINPELILEASELYVFNTKYGNLTHFVAEEGKKLSVHRTAIINYDKEKSKSKRMGRKSEEVIETVLRGGKLSLKNVFDITNNEFVEVPDRINENILLLKAKKA